VSSTQAKRERRAERSLARTLAALVTCEPATTARCAAASGLDEDYTRGALRLALDSGLVTAVHGIARGRSITYALTASGRTMAASHPAEPTSEAPKRPRPQGYMIPMNRPEGATDPVRAEDCGRYDDCLAAHALAYSCDARCPRGCRWWRPGEELRATDYAYAGRSCMATDERAGAAVASRVAHGRETHRS